MNGLATGGDRGAICDYGEAGAEGTCYVGVEDAVTLRALLQSPELAVSIGSVDLESVAFGSAVAIRVIAPAC